MAPAKTTSTLSTPSADADAPAHPGLTVLQQLLVSKALATKTIADEIRAQVAPTPHLGHTPKGRDKGHAYVPFDFTARFQGEVRIGGDTERKATCHFLRKALLALLLKRLGVQRDWIEANLPALIMEVVNMDKTEEEALFKSMPEFIEAMARVDKMVSELPRIPAKGAVSIRDLEVSAVETKVAAPSLPESDLPESALIAIEG
jgi:hypothetical protein